jgi:hypothetical protein
MGIGKASNKPMPQKSFEETPIVFRAEPISKQAIERFAEATRSEHFGESPLTFPTIFRSTEFQWLDRLKVDLRELLHTDQEYEYLTPLKEGDTATVYTRVLEFKERKGMRFVVLESEVRCSEKVVVRARSSFVLRSVNEGSPA